MTDMRDELADFTVVNEPKVPDSVDNLRWSADELRGQAVMATPGAWDDGEFPEMEFDEATFRERREGVEGPHQGLVSCRRGDDRDAHERLSDGERRKKGTGSVRHRCHQSVHSPP